MIPESFQLSAYSVADGKRLWWVRGLACEMKSIASTTVNISTSMAGAFRRINRAASGTIPFKEALIKYDKNGDGQIAKTEISGTEKMDKMLSAAFEAFDGTVTRS